MKTKKISLFMLFMTMSMSTRAMAAENEAYAVYTSSDSTLTFYYDNKKNDREGDKYSVYEWMVAGKRLIRVVFAQSFDNYRPTSTYRWFRNQTKLITIEQIRYLHTDSVTNMREMFYNCSSLTNLDVSGWDTSSVTNMRSVFDGCSSLTSLDVSSWDTSNVTSMSCIFYGCRSLTSLDVSSWDTGNVTDLSYMFRECSSLTSLDVSGWDTSSVTNMGSMFDGCSSLTSLDVSSWDTSNVTSMEGMFFGCSSLTSLDVSNWDTGNVTNMSYMFCRNELLKTIYAGSRWNTENVTNQENMFIKCYSLRGSSGTAYDPNHTDASYAHIDGGLDNPGYFSVRGYSLWVGGTEVTFINYESLPVMSGSASYDIANKTLTLNNAIINVNAQGGYCIANGLSAEQRVQGIDGLKIEVIGQCQLNGSDIALMINGNTTLTGTGRLSLNGTNTIWIEEGKGLTVAVKDFHATATQEVIYGDLGSLTVDGTKINSFVCEPKTPNWRYITIRGVFMTMNDCHFADPEGPWSSGDVEEFNYWDGYYMRYGTQQYCGRVLIEPDSKPVNYRLWVGGTRVTSANKDAISVASGTASYDPATYTLTLNNATIDAGGSDGISNGLPNLEGMADFKIVCKGTNNSIDAVNSDGYGLALYGNTTITGSRLGIKAYDKGIYLEDFKELNLLNSNVYVEASYPVYCGYNTFVYVRNSRLKADPGSSQNSPVEGAREFDLINSEYQDPDIGINPGFLSYNETAQKMYYNGNIYDGPILIVPTGVSISTNINEAGAPSTTDQPMYNLSGQRVGKDYKGIVIHNGKKVVR